MWEEPTRPGLFAVFADSSAWLIIDPGNTTETLPDYYDTHVDWLTCCFDGSDLDYIDPYMLLAPTFILQAYTIVEWHVSENEIIEAGQLLVTVRRNQTTRTIEAPRKSMVIEFYKKAGDTIVYGDQIALLAGQARIDVTRRALRLASKPLVTPSVENPLIFGDRIITKLYPTVGGNIGVGDRIAEALSSVSRLADARN
jgi:hypothetical protein